MALVPIEVVFEVPESVIQAGGIDLYANYYGWEPNVADPENEGQYIDNPETSLDFIKSRIRQHVKEDFSRAYVAAKVEQDRAVRVSEAAALLEELN